MAGDDPLTFIRQSLRHFRTCGSLTPSSLFLARAMAKSLPSPVPEPFRVLEVGSGTGSVTDEIIRRMNGHGRLDLSELDSEFCRVLRRRLQADQHWRKMQARVNVLQGDVRHLDQPGQYDAIISGLPFNSFQPYEVEQFLEHFQVLLKPHGILVWFEYVAIRRIQAPFVSRARREQLKDIRDITRRFARAHQIKQEIIPINLPPARIRYLRFG